MKCKYCKKEIDTSESFDGFVCEECGEVSEDDDGPLYECSSCGAVFTRGSSANDNHQCPDCNKFGAKQAEHGCSACQSAEANVVTIIQCPHCENLMEVE